MFLKLPYFRKSIGSISVAKPLINHNNTNSPKCAADAQMGLNFSDLSGTGVSLILTPHITIVFLPKNENMFLVLSCRFICFYNSQG